MKNIFAEFSGNKARNSLSAIGGRYGLIFFGKIF